MTLLVLGLGLFLVPHLIGLARPLKARIEAAVGRGAWKGIHAVLSLGGLVLIILGFRGAAFEPVYVPIAGRGLAHALMPLAFILLAGAHMPSNLKRYVRHPMSLGVMLWAGTHLAMNGDLASVLLFGAIGGFALLDFLLSPVASIPPTQPRRRDLALVVAAMIVYGAALWIHGALGYPVVG